MRVLLEAGVRAELAGLPPGPRQAVKAALATLHGHDGDRPPGLDVKRLQSDGQPKFRIKVGAYRIVFARAGQAHRVLKVFHRSDGYGWLERLG